MPHATNGDDNNFKLIQVKELHPTFGAEVHGIDFSKPVPEDVFSEIYQAITKVSITYCFYFPPSFT
jgi:alpha-ketoglutarate-dependent 2,4-dichlorophenoxyacetate dioxygenase